MNKTGYKSQKRIKKEAVVAKLGEKIAKAKALVFTNYQGLTHQQLESLKKAVRKVEAEYTITKNTLLKIALKEKMQLDIDDLDKPTATLFLFNDPIRPLKEIVTLVKTLNLPSIKFGVFEGKRIPGESVVKLATLPPREVLIAHVIGQMKAPLSALHRALNWNIQKLVFTLKAIETKKL